MKNHLPPFLHLVLLGAVVVMSGCKSPEPKLFVLSGMATKTAPPSEAHNNIAIGVGPIDLPDYLDRPQIVTRTGQNELSMSDFERWAEPLKYNALQTIAEDLAVLLSSNKVVTYPWKRAISVDLQVTVKVIRFERTDGGNTLLQARWSVLSGDGKTEVQTHETHYDETPVNSSYEATVASMNDALTRLARDIADAVRKSSIHH